MEINDIQTNGSCASAFYWTFYIHITASAAAGKITYSKYKQTISDSRTSNRVEVMRGQYKKKKRSSLKKYILATIHFV